jgi:putative SOS response-associated peptidase YedK
MNRRRTYQKQSESAKGEPECLLTKIGKSWSAVAMIRLEDKRQDHERTIMTTTAVEALHDHHDRDDEDEEDDDDDGDCACVQ